MPSPHYALHRLPLHCAAHAQPARLLPPAQLLHRLAAAAAQHHTVRRQATHCSALLPRPFWGVLAQTGLRRTLQPCVLASFPCWSALHRAPYPQAAVPDCGAMGGRQPSRVPSHGCGRWAGAHCPLGVGAHKARLPALNTLHPRILYKGQASSIERVASLCFVHLQTCWLATWSVCAWCAPTAGRPPAPFCAAASACASCR